MTSKNTVDPAGEDSLGVLDDTPSSDTSAIGLLGGTAQVSVVLPTADEDDDLVDEDVVEGEIISDLIIDTSALADEETIARIQQDASEIVIELPAEVLSAAPQRQPSDEVDADEVLEAEIVADAAPAAQHADAVEPGEPVESAEVVAAEQAPPPRKASARKAAARKSPARKAEARTSVARQAPEETPAAADPTEKQLDAATSEVAVADGGAASGAASAATPAAELAADAKPAAGTKPTASAEPAADAKPAAGTKQAAAAKPTAVTTPIPEPAQPGAEPAADAGDSPAGDAAANVEATELAHLQSAVAAAKAELREAMSPSRPRPEEEAAAKPRITQPAQTTAPGQTTEETAPVATDERGAPARAATETNRPAAEPVRPAEVPLAAKRLDDLGDAGRESADLLTADRLLDPARVSKPEPEGAWSHLLYAISGGRINIGDGRRARERKQLSARIAAPMPGTARFVPVLSRKGGVGKTTVTALLGMALADARDDRVIAVDANPDRGTLAERVVGGHTKSVRDLVRAQHDIRGFHDISALVARDETRLDVLASDADPRVSEAFGDAGYRDVASVAAQYYSLVLTDSGTGIVHSVMGATLDLADQIVIVSGLSVDEARLASETLTWLETNGRSALAREAIVVLNQSTPGAPLVRLSELEAHFSTRAKHVLRIPYDAQIAGGGAIDFGSLQPETRRAAREIAAVLVEGLRAKAA